VKRTCFIKCFIKYRVVMITTGINLVNFMGKNCAGFPLRGI